MQGAEELAQQDLPLDLKGLKDALVRGLEKEAAKTEARLKANIAKDKYIQENSP